MTGKILKWTEKEFEKVANDDNVKFRGAKAAGLGILEGTVDAAVVLGGVTLFITIASAVKDLFKK